MSGRDNSLSLSLSLSALKGRNDNFSQVITFVYGPNKRVFMPDFCKRSSLLNNDGVFLGLSKGISISYVTLTNRKGRRKWPRPSEVQLSIDQAELMDLPITDRLFTWSNIQDRPILARLEKVLVSSDWETHFLFATLRSIPRLTSNHVVLCINIGDNLATNRKIFHFEKNITRRVEL